MTTITIKNTLAQLPKTEFEDYQELFDTIAENQEFRILWSVTDENSLRQLEKDYEKTKTTPFSRFQDL